MKAITVLGAMALLVSACGGSGGSGGSSASPVASPKAETAQATKSPTAAPTTAVQVIDLKGKPIRIAQWWDGTPKPDTELGKQMIARQQEVEKKYNTKIEYVTVPWEELLNKVTSTSLSGEPFAEIIRMNSQWMPGLVKGGYIQPLDDLTDTKDPVVFTEALKKSSTYKGKIWSIMDNPGGTSGLFWNKTMFKREGLPDLNELQNSEQWTWDKFREIGLKLNKDTNGDGKLDQWGMADSGFQLTLHLIMSNNGHILNADSGTIAFTGKNEMEALDFMNKLYNTDKFFRPIDAAAKEDPLELFKQGKLGMAFGAQYMGEQMQKDMKDEWGFVFFPKGPQKQDYMVPSTDAQNFYIPTNNKVAKETLVVWKALQFWDKIEQKNIDIMEKAMPDKASFETAMKMKKANTPLENIYAFPGLDELLDQLTTNISTGKEPPATAVEKIKQEAQAKVDAVLKN